MTGDGVAYGLAQIETGPSVTTIGNFDGIHRGHRVLLRRTVDAALDRGIRSVAITFDPHPAAVLRPGSQPTALTSLEERVELLHEAGIDLVLVLPFDRELSELTPEGFVQRVLVERLRSQRVVIGTNFRFGHRAAGDVVALVELGEVHGFDVEAVALRDIDGQPLSSSAIRAALAQGQLDWATEALGRPYAVRGEVVPGDGRGRTIGVPTANVEVAGSRTLPAHGVYAGYATFEDRRWRTVTNVGVRPTFDVGDVPKVEAHLIDVDGDLDLYGQVIEVTFEHRLRGEQRFESVEDLVAQIRSDIDTARAWLVAREASHAGR